MNKIRIELSARSRRLLTVVGVLCSLAVPTACTQTDTPDEAAPAATRVPLNVQRVEADVANTPDTRGVINGANEAIGIFLAGTGYTPRANFRYYVSGGKWIPQDANNTLYLSVGAANLWAYYPFHSAYTNSAAIPLNSRVYTAFEDICYGPGTAVSGGTAALTSTHALAGIQFVNMSHAYALLTFKFIKVNYTAACVITKIQVRNVAAASTVNITTGAQPAVNSAVGSEVAQNVSISPATGAGTVSTDAQNVLLVPCTFANSGAVTGVANCGLQVWLTINNKIYKVGIPTANLDKVQAGKRYEVGINIQGDPAITLTNASVSTTDWVNKAINGGLTGGV